uniref:Uncharacterized protein n=1 Tax=Anguilla anguilla TaxID=7936 RepID=A0A0E9XZE4_ANGAN
MKKRAHASPSPMHLVFIMFIFASRIK